MNSKNIQDISYFNEKCLDFMSGKYIMADIKIKAIIRAINESSLLRTVISRCLNNYDFAGGFRVAFGNNFAESSSFILPEKNRERVALLYSILSSIDEEVISFYDFINKYIRRGNELGNADFQAFAKQIVQPFNEAMLALIESDFNDDTLVDRDLSLRRLGALAREEIENIESFRLGALASADLKTLLEAFAARAEKGDEKTVYALFIALDYFCTCNKRVRSLTDKLRECYNNSN